MGKMVYAAARGSYSDYGIEYIFETAKLRDDFIKKMNVGMSEYDEYFAEDYDLYDKAPRVYVEWSGSQRLDPETYEPLEEIYVSPRRFPAIEGQKPNKALVNTNTFGGRVIVTAVGRNKDEVVKAIRDRVAHMRAEKAGIA